MKPTRIFDTVYKDVPEDQKHKLRQFRGAHPIHPIQVEQTEWTYLRAGYSGQPILWLVGGLRMADAAFRSIPLLSDTYDIIAPNYPALATMAELADGLIAILDDAQVDKVSVLCGSFGGMLGQVFLRRHPERVGKIILSTTTAPDSEQRAHYEQQLAQIASFDDATLAQIAQQTMLATLQTTDDDRAFWQAYLEELYEHRLKRADIVTTYQALIDFMQHDFSAEDLTDWFMQGGNMLIFASDDDSTFGDAQQQALQALYPQADVYTFAGAGHSPSTTQRDIYFDKVRAFFG